jgi:hypothetical protein
MFFFEPHCGQKKSEIFKTKSTLTMLVNQPHQTSNLFDRYLNSFIEHEIVDAFSSNESFQVGQQIKDGDWIKIVGTDKSSVNLLEYSFFLHDFEE